MTDTKTDVATSDLKGLPSNHPERIRRCYCIFEGGGAKGMLHLGVLKALQEAENRNDEVGGPINIRGYAGTSAGAIVAALAAAGFTASELLNSDGSAGKGNRSILDKINLPASGRFRRRVLRQGLRPVETPFNLIGSSSWRLRFFRLWAMYNAWLTLVLIIFAGLGLLLIFIAPLVLWLSSHHTDNWCSFGSLMMHATVPYLLVFGAAIFFVYLLARGLVCLDRVRDGMEAALRLKVTQASHTGVTFRDLDAYWREKGREPLPLLKIVATDLNEARALVFSSRTTPDVRIADAVAASIAAPVLFRPWPIIRQREWRLSTRWFFDGALVSNLPAWVFDEEREIDPDAATCVSRVTSPAETSGFSGAGAGQMISAISSVFARDPLLETRAIDRLFITQIDVDNMGLLDFDTPFEKVVSRCEGVYKKGKDDIILRIIAFQRDGITFCDEIRFALANVKGLIFGKKCTENEFRAAVFLARPGPRGFDGPVDPLFLTNCFASGYDGRPDRYLRLPVSASRCGRAWSEGIPIAWGDLILPNGASPDLLDGTDLSGDHEGLRGFVCSRMKWSVALPYDLSILDQRSGVSEPRQWQVEESGGQLCRGRRRLIVAIDGEGYLGSAQQNEDFLNLVRVRILDILSWDDSAYARLFGEFDNGSLRISSSAL